MHHLRKSAILGYTQAPLHLAGDIQQQVQPPGAGEAGGKGSKDLYLLALEELNTLYINSRSKSL